jgi:uncharacterized protein (TIGR02453 family)
MMVGGGWYFVESPQLYKIRQKISEEAEPFLQIIHKPEFVATFGDLNGEKLKTTPKGFDPTDPHIELLRFKNYLATTKLNVKNVSDEQIKSEIIERFKVLTPLVQYLRENS